MQAVFESRWRLNCPGNGFRLRNGSTADVNWNRQTFVFRQLLRQAYRRNHA